MAVLEDLSGLSNCGCASHRSRCASSRPSRCGGSQDTAADESTRPAPPALPWSARLQIFALSAAADLAQRSNGTVNRFLFKLGDRQTPARPRPDALGIRSTDLTEAELSLEGVAPLVNMRRSDWSWRAFLPEGADRNHLAAHVMVGALDEGKITQYFRSKSVLITGSTGFLGKILVEKILRVQPNVKKI
ncbi:hypothetical protein ACQ4PT_019602 [Festuca glaucescens]